MKHTIGLFFCAAWLVGCASAMPTADNPCVGADLTTDAFGKRVRGRLFTHFGELHAGLRVEDRHAILRTTFLLNRIVDTTFPKGSEVVIALADGTVFSVPTTNTSSPAAYASQYGVTTSWAVEVAFTRAQLAQLERSPLRAVKLKGDTELVREVHLKIGDGVRYLAQCLSHDEIDDPPTQKGGETRANEL